MFICVICINVYVYIYIYIIENKFICFTGKQFLSKGLLFEINHSTKCYPIYHYYDSHYLLILLAALSVLLRTIFGRYLSNIFKCIYWIT